MCLLNVCFSHTHVVAASRLPDQEGSEPQAGREERGPGSGFEGNQRAQREAKGGQGGGGQGSRRRQGPGVQGQRQPKEGFRRRQERGPLIGLLLV